MYYKTTYPSPIGLLTLASDGENLIGLWMEGQQYFADTVPGEMIERDDLAVFVLARNWLARYFSGEKPEISEIPLAPVGGEFRKIVWKILAEIPCGKVTTYGDIAKRVAKTCGVSRMSAQAVGGAVKHNPISIILPCHRVVGSKGALTGYAGGIDKKIWLLNHEGVDLLDRSCYNHFDN